MPYTPSQKLNVKAEIFINGAWVTITSRSRSVGGVQIKHGQSDGASQPETSRCRITIGNDDGWLTEENPASGWWPYIGRGTPLRVSLTGILAADAGRFAGEIDEMVAVYPGGNSSAMEIEAIGTWGILEQNDDPLRSALYRAITTSSPAPIAYWSFEDGIRAQSAASSIAGGQPFLGSIAFEAAQGPDGSGPVASSRDRGTSSGAVLGCGTTAWRVEHVALWRETDDHTPSASIEIGASGSIYLIRLTVDDSPDNVIRFTYFVPGGGVATSIDTTATAFDGEWKHIVVDAVQFGGDVDVTVVVNGVLVLDTTIAGQTMGAVTRCTITTFEDTADADIPLVGHIAVWSGAMPTVDTFAASTGYTDDLVTDRIGRLADEEGLTVTILGESTQRMGPQRPAKITDLFGDCQKVDLGLWSDDQTDIGLVYRTQSHLYTQLAQVAITAGTLTPDTAPRWDYQRLRNEVTVTRDGGQSATQSDEEHITRIRRRIKGTDIIPIAGDEHLDQHARWRVHLGTARGPRYPVLGINLRNNDGAVLADSVLGLEVGDRMTIAAEAFPTQHPPGGADQMVIGWQELLDADFWAFAPVCMPYQPYNDVGRWALLSHELRAAVNSSVTSIDIVNTSTTQPMLATSTTQVGSGYGITVGGEEMQLTAVAASTITFGSAGTVSHANNANVTPGLPASLAAGDLMVMVAVIRNSGGTPNTPSGWTRLAVFPAATNIQIFAKIAGAGESGPTVSFAGGIANADTTAQIIRLTGKWHSTANILIGAASCTNASAQNITVPGLSRPDADNCILIGVGWRQDDWTSVDPRSGWTEIAEPDTTTGDDHGMVWDHAIQTTAADIAATPFVVTGGAPAISRSAVFALRCDYQSATVTRSINGITASHSAADAVTMTRPMRWGLV